MLLHTVVICSSQRLLVLSEYTTVYVGEYLGSSWFLLITNSAIMNSLIMSFGERMIISVEYIMMRG